MTFIGLIIGLIGTTIALILCIFGKKLYRFYLFYQRINKIPGPDYSIPFFGFVLKLLKIPNEDRLDWLQRLSNPYNDGIFRVWIGPNGVIMLFKPEHVEVILRSSTQIKKSKLYDFFVPWLGRGLLTSDGPQWSHDRKLIVPAFHYSVLDKFAEVMIEKANILIECIDKEMKIHGEKPFDIFNLILKCALDIICETAMGVNIYAQEKSESEYTKAVNTISTHSVARLFSPWLMVDWIFYRSATGKAFQAAIETTRTFCTRIIERKQKERKLEHTEKHELNKNNDLGRRDKKAFLDLLLEANEKDDNPLTNEEIMNQANTFMFAGHDTTGALVGWTLFCLGNDLNIQKKLYEELDEVLGDADDQATLKLLPNLKYLERVVKEVLRLYPGATTISRKITEDMKIGDYTVPDGANLDIDIYLLHRNSSIWPDPLRFDPDRFLPENVKDRHPYAYIPFSAGPRNCIGQKYAMLETKVLLTQILRKFSVKSVENHSTIKKYSELILRPIDGIFVNLTKRSPGNKKK